jgi:hypothetical protein
VVRDYAGQAPNHGGFNDTAVAPIPGAYLLRLW